MRPVLSSTVRHSVHAFLAAAAEELSAQAAGGAEVPFELEQAGQRGRGAALYCYRPLTRVFIEAQFEQLTRLGSYDAAERSLAQQPELETYLAERGERRVPRAPHAQAALALTVFLSRVFHERSDFELEPQRLAAAFTELERGLCRSGSQTVVVTPLLGLELDEGSSELLLGEGLALVRGDVLRDAPPEAAWSESGEANLMAVLTVADDGAGMPAVALARTRFRRLLTALRLYESGGFCAGPLAWARREGGAWWPIQLGGGGRSGVPLLLSAEQEDEFRAFCNLVARRAPVSGEAAWALARFEMGCERLSPLEALTDHLLALRALLEPEGPSTGRLAQRLAVICATPEERAELSGRTAQAIELERAAIAGRSVSGGGAGDLVQEMAEHLRAILRDLVCGHLSADLCAVAEEILAETVAVA